MSWAAIIPAVATLLGEAAELWQGDKKRQAELVLEQLKNAQAQLMGQLDINRVEAAHQSVFVSGWRPAIGWVIACVLAAEFLVRPILTWFGLLLGWQLPPMPSMVSDAMWELMFGMLGLSGMRSWEKTRGVAR